jgi:hypothetical protein
MNPNTCVELRRMYGHSRTQAYVIDSTLQNARQRCTAARTVSDTLCDQGDPAFEGTSVREEPADRFERVVAEQGGVPRITCTSFLILIDFTGNKRTRLAGALACKRRYLGDCHTSACEHPHLKQHCLVNRSSDGLGVAHVLTLAGVLAGEVSAEAVNVDVLLTDVLTPPRSTSMEAKPTHEMCHAAKKYIDGSKPGHGPGFRKWGASNAC